MSEPIILTERERTVFASFATELERSKSLYRVCVGDTIREWLAGMPPAESASPPRVPTTDLRHPNWRAKSQEGVQSGPGQPIEYTTAREQDRAEGYRAGIEAAAQWHSEIAKEHRRLGNTDWSAAHEGFAATMRALADKPAPDAARQGG